MADNQARLKRIKLRTYLVNKKKNIFFIGTLNPYD